MAIKVTDAFMARKIKFDAMLERLKTLSDDHFGVEPDAINWGDVGVLSFYVDTLQLITNVAFQNANQEG